MYKYVLTDDDLKYCEKHAQLMCDGFKTYSFKNNKMQSFDVYNIGKIGELICDKYFQNLEDKNIIIVNHKPFRENYKKLNWKDDFMIRSIKNQEDIQIEVRTKGRNVDPLNHYVCCSDSISPKLIYYFVSLNKKTNIGFIVGWADWDVFRKYAYIIKKGNDNGTYINKTTEFGINIEHLNPIK